MKKLIVLAAVIFGFTATSFAQATATATATATIVTPISIEKTADMNFGNVAVSGTAGTVVLATDNDRTTTGGVTLPAVAGTVEAASFTIGGVDGYGFAITLPNDHVITQGENTMTVNNFTSDPTPTGTLTGGSATLKVGATLNVTADQAAGVYTSATGFDVTVNYN